MEGVSIRKAVRKWPGSPAAILQLDCAAFLKVKALASKDSWVLWCWAFQPSFVGVSLQGGATLTFDEVPAS